MPKVSFIPDNQVVTTNDFPRLKLDKDETARIVVLEDATYVYVHTLRAPEIGPDGRAITHMVDRRDGSQVEAFKMGFIGRPQCLGNLDTLMNGRGVDPDNCPACEMAVKSSMVDAPQRRFAVHVAKYAVKPGSFDVARPFSAQIQVWSFTETIFNKLVEFQKDFGPLLNRDLKLGPCSNKDFQKFEINIAGEAEWLKDEKRKEYIKEAFEENRASDLEEFCGRRVDKKWLVDDLSTIRERWAVANGEKAADTPDQKDLNNLIGNGKPAEATSPTPPPPPTPSPTPPGPPTPPPMPAAVEADAEVVVEEKESEPAAAASAKPKSLSFDDLISNL